jgi:hypothetical protein
LFNKKNLSSFIKEATFQDEVTGNFVVRQELLAYFGIILNVPSKKRKAVRIWWLVEVADKACRNFRNRSCIKHQKEDEVSYRRFGTYRGQAKAAVT